MTSPLRRATRRSMTFSFSRSPSGSSTSPASWWSWFHGPSLYLASKGNWFGISSYLLRHPGHISRSVRGWKSRQPKSRATCRRSKCVASVVKLCLEETFESCFYVWSLWFLSRREGYICIHILAIHLEDVRGTIPRSAFRSKSIKWPWMTSTAHEFGCSWPRSEEPQGRFKETNGFNLMQVFMVKYGLFLMIS